MLAVATIMIMAFLNFARILSKLPVKNDINSCLIMVEIMSVLAFSVCVIGTNCEIYLHRDELYKYEYQIAIIIFELGAVYANAINFSIMGIILYKSMGIA